MVNSSPTPHPDVNEILNLLLIKGKEILQGQLVGMYLFGSLANGGFDEHSDIDVLFVTRNVIPEVVFNALYEMHETISAIDSPWAIQLEVSYIPQAALRRYDPSNNKHPHLDRGPDEKLAIRPHDADWIIQRYLLRKNGITITGPDAMQWIDPVSPADLRCAVSDILQNWFQHFLDVPDPFKSRGYQSYTVLTMCRILYTWENGDVVSKPTAVEWAKQNLNNKWTGLIDCAWTGRQTPAQDAEPEDIQGTLGFIRYTLESVSVRHSI